MGVVKFPTGSPRFHAHLLKYTGKENRGHDTRDTYHLARTKKTTRRLGIASNPIPDYLNPQETTKEDGVDKGLDGADLSSPGSGVVAEEDVPQETKNPQT